MANKVPVVAIVPVLFGLAAAPNVPHLWNILVRDVNMILPEGHFALFAVIVVCFVVMLLVWFFIQPMLECTVECKLLFYMLLQFFYNKNKRNAINIGVF